MTDGNMEALKILEQFAPGKGNNIPVLDAASQAAVRSYLKEGDMEMTGGCLTSSRGDPEPIDLVLSHDREISQGLSFGNGSIVGPYFLDDEYYPCGIGVWTPKS